LHATDDLFRRGATFWVARDQTGPDFVQRDRNCKGDGKPPSV
jgi:hypothetical protein